MTTPQAATIARAFGARVCELRHAARLTQRGMAKLFGLRSPNSITCLERGTATHINLAIFHGLIGLAQQQGRSAEWLLTGAERPVTPDIDRLGRAIARRLVTFLDDQEAGS